MRARLYLIAFVPLCVLSVVLAVARYAWSVIFAPARARKIAIAFDELGNTAANGNPGETLSSRAGRAQLEEITWGCVLCRVLDWFQPGHCKNNIQPQFL